MDPTLDNDYDDDSSEDTHSEKELFEVPEFVYEEHEVFVIGQKINDKKISKTKSLVYFKSTRKGWDSHSLLPGMTNKYVSKETWNEIEDKWLCVEMAYVEVFWDYEEAMERCKELDTNDVSGCGNFVNDMDLLVKRFKYY